MLATFLIDLVPVLRLPLLQATWVQVDIVFSGIQTLGCYKHVSDKTFTLNGSTILRREIILQMGIVSNHATRKQER